MEASIESGFKSGIVITHNHWFGSCKSYIGKCPGCGWPGQYEAPSTWQVINLSAKCGAFKSERPTKHEFLHAFGFLHEQSRPGIHTESSELRVDLWNL